MLGSLSAIVTGARRPRREPQPPPVRTDGAASEAESRELYRLRAALNEIDDGIILLDSELRVDFINRAACNFGGLSLPQTGAALTYAELIRRARVAKFQENLDAFIARRVETVRAGDPTPIDLRFAGGQIMRAKCTVLPAGGRLLSYTDVTDLVRHNEELETLRAALDQVAIGVILLDQDLRAQFINRAFRRMSDMSDEFAQGRPTFSEIMEHGRRTSAFAVSKAELDTYIANRIEMVRKGDPRPVELRWSHGRVVRYQIAPLPGGGRMLTYTDITDLARTAEQLEKLATTDGLTGLYNRRHFIVLAEREWSRFHRYGRPFSLLLLDIDSFKAVNDHFGHHVGDQMIIHVGNLCQECKRDPDFVARVGGEEFALLLPETELADAYRLAERLREMVAERPLVAAGITVPVTISVGVAEVDSAMSGVSDLMKLADRMLYEAKRTGRNRVASPDRADARLVHVAQALAPI